VTQSNLEELYQEVILDHYKNPRCFGHCAEPTATVEAYNPLCGDTVTVEVQVELDRIIDIRFSGAGCSISQAAASIMAEVCLGKSVAEVARLHALYESMILEEPAETSLAELGDAAVLRGIKKFPARYRCALLGWQALKDALNVSGDSKS
jgi:nitrogen fixation NifU-like protein